MSYLLDTTAISEMTKPRPNAGFRTWLERQKEHDAAIGTPSVGEIEAGIHYLPPSEKRRHLERWFVEFVARFSARILPFDVVAARAWGRAAAAARREGKTLPVVDSQLAAIAFTQRLTVVTRNVRHFEIGAFESLDIVNPWS